MREKFVRLGSCGTVETGYGEGECFAHSGYHLREADLLVEIAARPRARWAKFC